MRPLELVAIFDSSAIIAIRERHYPPDVFLQLNHNIERAAANGKVCIVQEVLDELGRMASQPNPNAPSNASEVFDWARSTFRTARDLVPHRDNNAVLRLARDIRLSHQDWFDTDDVADPFIIAEAEYHGCAVVSTEIAQFREAQGRPVARFGRYQLKNEFDRFTPHVRIPDMCLIRGVPHYSLLEFFRSQRWKF